MGRRILLLSIFLLFIALPGNTFQMIGGILAPTSSYVLSESYDGAVSCATSYTSTCDNTWTVTKGDAGDTVDFDNAATPAPIDGTYSLRLTSTTTSNTTTEISFTAADNVYLYLKINFDSLGTDTEIRAFAGIQSSSADLNIGCLAGTNNRWSIWTGSAFEEGASLTPSADNTYHVWIEYLKGNPGTANLYASSDGTKPGSPTVTVAQSSNTQASKIILTCRYNTNVVFDKIRVSTTSIGSNPS